MKITSFLIFKSFIVLFWFLGVLVFIDDASRGLITFDEWDIAMLICLAFGCLSVMLERFYKKRSLIITYFLSLYFIIPIFYTVSISYYVLAKESEIRNLIDMGAYCGLFLFSFLSICGFISYIKEKYKILIIYFVVCILFYFPFLPAAVYLFFP